MKAVFGAFICFILLGIYSYLIYFGIQIVGGSQVPTCAGPSVSDFSDGMASTLTLVGGLVSAVVVAELGATKRGHLPGEHLIEATITSKSWQWTGLLVVTMVYLLIWLAGGLAAFWVGYLQHPDILEPLSSLGQAWLGIAVGSGYAYLGINRA